MNNILKCVLAVEDDKPSQNLMVQAFKSAGLTAELIFKEKGEDALEFLSRDPQPRPDLIILDLNLPGKSGLEILQEIRQLPPFQKTFVLLMTGSSSLDEKRVAKEYPCCGFANKPSRFQELVALVQSFPKIQSPDSSS